MSKRVTVNEFKRIFDKGIHYPRKAVKELAAHKGYQIPSAFWIECELGNARYGVLKEALEHHEAIDIDESEFKVDVEHLDEISTVIEVTHKKQGGAILTTIPYGMDTRPHIEKLMKSFSPYNTKHAHLPN